MKDPTQFTDAELQAEFEKLQKELSKREDEKKKIAEAKRQARLTRQREFFVEHPEVVDFIAPNHSRSSCSDTNVSNGSPNHIRCVRCALLDYTKEPWEFDGAVVAIPNLEL